MASKYDMTNIDSCIDYLADLVDTLNDCCFKQNVRDAFPEKIASRMTTIFQDKLIIPLGQMKTVLEKAYAVTNHRFTPAEKIQYDHDNAGKLPLSLQMYDLFSQDKLIALSRQSRALAERLEHKMNQLDNMDVHNERELQDQHNLTKRLETTAQFLTRIAERLENNATFFDVEYKQGIGALYDTVKTFEKSLERGRKKG